MARCKKRGGLSFKDLLDFNKALLGKQVWRMLTCPNSLVARILKDRYYPKESILSCKASNQSSWIWQSLLGARDIVANGARKKIGNGENTHVWKERWVPKSRSGCPRSRIADSERPVMVSDLITDFRWDRQLVFKTFHQEDARHILRIPISLSGRRDCYFWPYEGSGKYSVKSAYNVIRMSKEIPSTTPSLECSANSGLVTGKMWKHLWKMKIKHKVKLFLWRCLLNMLPVKEQINKRLKTDDVKCSACGEEVETIEHIFFFCSKAVLAWDFSPLRWEGLMDQRGNFKKWWTGLLEARERLGGESHIRLTAYILWRLWKNRNYRIFEGKEKEPWRIIQLAQNEWAEFEEAQASEILKKRDITEEDGDNRQASPQPDSMVTFNVEILKHDRGQILGIGVVGLNVHQEPVYCWLTQEQSTGEEVLDMAVSLKLILCKISRLQWRNIAIACSSKQLLQTISSKATRDVCLHAVMEEIISLSNMFVYCAFILIEKVNEVFCKSLCLRALSYTQEVEWFKSQVLGTDV